MKDPYSVIGLSRDADTELLKARYKELHDLYGEQRFKSGEEGNEGARKLQELEEAWVLISSDIEKTENKTAFGGDYSQIDSLIRDGKYNEAQDMLDSITDRKGEWHYMQAIVFYKREWLSEAKTQLEMALQDDPNNSKYRSSLDKLNLTMGGGPRPAPQQPNANNGGYNNGNANGNYNGGNGGGYYGGGYYGGDYQGQNPNDTANCLSTCCCAYCLTDCLCSAMRCC